MLVFKWLNTFGNYLILMGRSFSRPERMRMFLKRYVKEMSQLGVDSIGIVLLISVLHRCGDMYTDQAQRAEPLDASLGVGLCDT